jgi:hypothetical protein
LHGGNTKIQLTLNNTNGTWNYDGFNVQCIGMSSN